MSPSSRPLSRSRALAFTSLLFLAACEQVLPTAPEIERLDVHAVERFRYAPSFWMDSTLLYFVDGRPVSAAESRAIPAAHVASIRMTRDREGRKASSLHVTTSPTPGGTKAIDCTGMVCTDGPNPEGGPGEIIPGAGVAIMMQPRMVRRFAGLVIVDGQQVEVGTFMSRHNTDDFESLEILKGSTAAQLYSDPRAAYGVIRITTWMRDGICPTDLVEGSCPGRDPPPRR